MSELAKSAERFRQAFFAAERLGAAVMSEEDLKEAERHASILEAIQKWVDSPTKFLGSNQGDFERGTREGQKRAKDYVRQLLEQPGG